MSALIEHGGRYRVISRPFAGLRPSLPKLIVRFQF